MAKSRSKRKTRSDKFPLTLHKTGQFCKKIQGKLHYFGADKQKALQRHLAVQGRPYCRSKLLRSKVHAPSPRAWRNRDGLPFGDRPLSGSAVKENRGLRAELLQIAVGEL